MRKAMVYFGSLACLAFLATLPVHAQSNAPLSVNAFVQNQTCISKDFVQVTLSASATSDSHPVGFRWDLNNDNKLDTQLSTDPDQVHVYADESAVSVKVLALNKAGQRATDSLTFTTLRCK